jgi:hypothetical protein
MLAGIAINAYNDKKPQLHIKDNFTPEAVLTSLVTYGSMCVYDCYSFYKGSIKPVKIKDAEGVISKKEYIVHEYDQIKALTSYFTLLAAGCALLGLLFDETEIALKVIGIPTLTSIAVETVCDSLNIDQTFTIIYNPINEDYTGEYFAIGGMSSL